MHSLYLEKSEEKDERREKEKENETEGRWRQIRFSLLPNGLSIRELACWQ